MLSGTHTLIVLGAHSRRGLEWLADRFPDEEPNGRAFALSLPLGELDSVLWAEQLRADARREGVRLSIGLAPHAPDRTLRASLELAVEAYRRAFALGGDITIPSANLVRTARRNRTRLEGCIA